jgi:hypothetical protein
LEGLKGTGRLKKLKRLKSIEGLEGIEGTSALPVTAKSKGSSSFDGCVG